MTVNWWNVTLWYTARNAIVLYTSPPRKTLLVVQNNKPTFKDQ